MQAGDVPSLRFAVQLLRQAEQCMAISDNPVAIRFFCSRSRYRRFTSFMCAHVKSKMMVLLGRKFCKAKAKKRGARDLSSPYKDTKEQDMAYLILVAVVAMMALYALIIVGCLKQPEW